jgi:hypothetical protein
MPTILKGFHRPLLPKLGLSFNQKHFNRLVQFTDSCRYELAGADIWDTNKLYGVGYLPHHHKDSARFGWLYFEGKIYLNAYCHVNGQRHIQEICAVEIGKRYRLHLYVSKTTYFFWVVDHATQNTIGEVNIKRGRRGRIGYLLGLYFGGNKKAPHNITVNLKRF